MAKTYDLKKIDELLDVIRMEIGDDRFAAMRLMELEKVVRRHDSSHELPGKTLLRERIHAFRAARWPHLKPKAMSSRFRW
jgi:hypothetical protein